MNELKQLPPGWKEITVKDISLKISYGYTASSTRNDTGIKFLRITDIQDYKVDWDAVPFCEIDEDDVAKFLLKKGDIVFARTGATVGKSFLISGAIPKSVFASYLIRIELSQYVDPKYLFYFFQSAEYWSQIGIKSMGIGQPNVNANTLSNISLPLSSLIEQQEIVEKIEALFTKLNRSEDVLKQIDSKIQIYKQSILNSVFNEKLNDSLQKWETKPLDKVCSKIQDGSHFSPPIQHRDYAKGRFLYITSKNIRNNFIDLSDVTYVDKKFHESIYSRCNPEFGDVLLTKDGANTGNVTLNSIKDPFSMLSSVCLLKPNRDIIDQSFLKYYIQSPQGYRRLTGKMTGTAIKRIILKRIKETLIAYPSIHQQKAIVQDIEYRLTIAEKLQKTIKHTIEAIGATKHGLLKKAFMGELIVNMIESESTLDLLALINAEKEAFKRNADETFSNKIQKRKPMADKTIIQVLESTKKPMDARDVWLQSKHKNNIEDFYSALKSVQSKINSVKKGTQSLLSLKK